MNTPLETNVLPENKAAIITVQRITEVINRWRNTCAFEGVGAVSAASDMRRKIAGATGVANTDPAMRDRVLVSRRTKRSAGVRPWERRRLVGGLELSLSQGSEPAGRQRSQEVKECWRPRSAPDSLNNCTPRIFVPKLFMSKGQGWGRSSVGRAAGSQSAGQGFESPRLHHLEHCSETSDVLRMAREVSAKQSKGFLKETVKV